MFRDYFPWALFVIAPATVLGFRIVVGRRWPKVWDEGKDLGRDLMMGLTLALAAAGFFRSLQTDQDLKQAEKVYLGDDTPVSFTYKCDASKDQLEVDSQKISTPRIAIKSYKLVVIPKFIYSDGSEAIELNGKMDSLEPTPVDLELSVGTPLPLSLKGTLATAVPGFDRSVKDCGGCQLGAVMASVNYTYSDGTMKRSWRRQTICTVKPRPSL